MTMLRHFALTSSWSIRRGRFPNDVALEIKNNGEVHITTTKEVFPIRMRILFGISVFDRKLLSDRSAVDYPSRTPRFDVVYQLVSVRYGYRCRVKVSIDDGERIPTRTGRYASANWAERECYDMFGIPFEGHPDLRRLLTDYGFEGHPMRKDFPLTGYTEVRYDEISKRVVNESVEVTQEIRMQEINTSWKPGKEVSRAQKRISQALR